jgi:hypothetical protein
MGRVVITEEVIVSEKKADKKIEEVIHISDLRPETPNARVHTPRNIGMITDSLQEVGAARSIVIDEDNVVLAGNGVVEGASQVDMTKVRVVEADGSELIAVRRRGLTDAQKRRLALYDNRTSELSDWDPQVLAQLRADDMLTGLFSEDELKRILAEADAPDGFRQLDESTVETNTKCPKCGYEWSET